MKTWSITLILALLPALLWAQKGGTMLKGRVVDDQRKPVEFATVVLTSGLDSTRVVQATATDTTGDFELTGVPLGRYTLRISMLGYRAIRPTLLTVAAESTMALGLITLASSTQQLGEVTVTGERPAIERTLGKLTLNVSNSFFKTAPNALEVLRRAPGVRVDPLGGISLKGTVKPVVYLDGKQIPLTPEEIQALSTEDIEQVEILPNASAQFDGQTQAVINIKRRHDKTLGAQGSAYAGVSRNRLYGGYELGSSLTYKLKKLALYGRASYAETNKFLQANALRSVPDATSKTEFSTYTFLHYRERPLSYQFSADYSLTPKQTLGLQVQGLAKHETDQTTNITSVSRFDPAGALLSAYTLPSTTDATITPGSLAFDLNYRGVLDDKGSELVAYADYARYSINQQQVFRTAFPQGQNTLRFPGQLLGDFPSSTRISALRTDYTHVIRPTITWSAGAKYSHTTTDNELRYDTLSENGSPRRDFSRSNHFLYDEKIVAAYASWAQTWGNTSIDAGLRSEFTRSTGNSLTLNNIVNRSYYRWLPSLQAQHKFDDQHTLAFTYSRKMWRPSFADLNPFQFYTSPYEYIEGNPFLLPATINSTELRYSVKDVTVTASYQLTRDQITQLPTQDPVTQVIRYTQANLDRVQTASLEVSAPFTITKWWKLQHTASFYHVNTRFATDAGLTPNKAWSFETYGQQIFSLPHDFTLEVSYDYRAPGVSSIYRNKSSGTVGFSAQKSVLKGQGNIQLNCSDLFNTYREAFSTQYNDIDVQTTQKRHIQKVALRFTYRFGKSTFTRKNRASGSVEEEGRAR